MKTITPSAYLKVCIRLGAVALLLAARSTVWPIEILWRHSNGDNRVWFMNQTTFGSSAPIQSVPDPGWVLSAVGDFNRDSKTDIVWRHSSGLNAVWLMNALELTAYPYLPSEADPAWRIVATGDFNGDQNNDILWRHSTSGANVVWFMNGTTKVGQATVDPSVADPNWQIVGAADFSSPADGKVDILWRNYSTGDNVIWFMNGIQYVSYAAILGVTDTNWRVGGVGDFNGDGKPDIAWRHALTGDNAVWFMNGATFAGSAGIQFEGNLGWQMKGVGDWNDNVMVNSRQQDEGNEQNTQSETTLLAFDNTVIVAYVDSNFGVAGYGQTDDVGGCPVPSQPSRFIGWAVSTDGGKTFLERELSNLPLFQPGNLGDAGDPVLARDNTTGTIYLVGNPKRPGIYQENGQPRLFTPLWRSYDNGLTFSIPVNAAPGRAPTTSRDFDDKPALVVDNVPGTGRGNVYMAVVWRKSAPGTDSKIIVARSQTGGGTWEERVQLGTPGSAGSITGPALGVGPDHQVYVVWRDSAGGPQRLLFSKSLDRGTSFSAGTPFLTLNHPVGDLQLRRSNSGDALDTFRTPILPNLSVNMINGHVYLVYADRSPDGLDRANVYLTQSADGGQTWSHQSIGPIRVNNDATTTDQWQPSVVVNPDGSKLFIAWYDRRGDAAQNSMIRTYGVIASLPITGSASFNQQFVISRVEFPPVFTGTTMTQPGQYDPTYPPYPCFGGAFAGHMGDYDTAVATASHVLFCWGDNREFSRGTVLSRKQADVRFARRPW